MFERNQRYDSSDKFFELRGFGTMKLTRSAAQEVCCKAIQYELIVVRVEGGIWHNPGYESRMDAIWDGFEPLIDRVAAEQNNEMTANFIRNESLIHDAFIVLTVSISGYPHNLKSRDVPDQS